MKNRNHSYLLLLIFSFSLSCNGLQAPSSLSLFEGVGRSSQKYAAVSQVVVFDSPEMASYIHPSLWFSYEAPLAWKTQSTPLGVVVYSPESIVLSVSLIHTGYRLSSMSFLQLAANTEATYYGDREKYTLISLDEDRSARFVFSKKTFIQNGIRKLAMSIYRQVGNSMYVVEMVGDRLQIIASPKYEALFSSFNESIRDQQDSSVRVPAYVSSRQYTESNHDYFIDIPIGWELISEQSSGMTHSQFSSPDGNAVIETFLLEYGETTIPRIAVKEALKLLDAAYAKGSDDIRVTSEVILQERASGKIKWITRSGGYAGETYFEVRNKTQIFILTCAWNRLFEDIYEPVVDTAVLTYRPFSSPE